MLYPMNMSSAWIAANRERIPAMKRAGYIGNDGYAMQNLMESFASFKPLTPDLGKIKVPTLIMNGEFDFFTPRECHELIRSKVANSRLVIIQRAYHAFTLEAPAVTMRQIEVFLDQVSTGNWKGDQSVWIANDDPAAAEQWLPCAGDWMRAVQIAAPAVKLPAKRPPRVAAKPPAKAPATAPGKTVTRKAKP
jgi:poly(3-hydroxyalkanoate) synthetase